MKPVLVAGEIVVSVSVGVDTDASFPTYSANIIVDAIEALPSHVQHFYDDSWCS